MGVGVAIGLGLTALGSLISSIVSAQQQKEATIDTNNTNLSLTNSANASQLQQVQATNEFNAAEAQKARDYDKMMSDTQVQRAMADYQAAGLNPLLAATNGASYQTPASASGTVASVKAGKVNPAYLDLSGLASAFSSMSNAMLISSLLKGNNGSGTLASLREKWKENRYWKEFYKKNTL